MVHRNARLTVTGRLILVRRILGGRPVSHVAKEMGVSRQCAHRWVGRYRVAGEAGLSDRSSRPVSSPAATPPETAAAVVELRSRERLGRDEVARACGISPRTASRLIAKAGLPALHQLDPVTGIALRASRRTQVRYERDAPGDLIHIDVKKLGRIPDGGGWRTQGPDFIDHHHGRDRKVKLGFDYVHVAVDDHSRLAFAQIPPDEKGTTCAAFLAAATDFFARHGIPIREVMTDNAKNYTVSTAFQTQLHAVGATHITTRPHCPWQNGKAERFNRTMQEYWAYRAPYISNQHRADALAPWLEHYNYARPHTACGGRPPISRVSPTS
ncbi:IS481 family transposase [Ruicaihuangia caeni]|uniref:IS481 family transposase n=1 Tax=Ruicaihuangia caeni TaxID=3042517 RepID=UPI00338EC377